MTTATITRIYQVNLNSPLWDKDMTPEQRLHASLEMARMCPEEFFECLVQDDVDGVIND